jgi:hypothetical protein
MGSGQQVLRLFLLDPRRADPGQVRLVDQLGARCRVGDGPQEWRVSYETDDVSEAMRMCATDLDAIDPHWHEILDFSAVESSRRRRAGVR